MIMHVQADTMMQNTGPGKVHTQFYFYFFLHKILQCCPPFFFIRSSNAALTGSPLHCPDSPACPATPPVVPLSPNKSLSGLTSLPKQANILLMVRNHHNRCHHSFSGPSMLWEQNRTDPANQCKNIIDVLHVFDDLAQLPLSS